MIGRPSRGRQVSIVHAFQLQWVLVIDGLYIYYRVSVTAVALHQLLSVLGEGLHVTIS